MFRKSQPKVGAFELEPVTCTFEPIRAQFLDLSIRDNANNCAASPQNCHEDQMR